jgi:hypothetical protein
MRHRDRASEQEQQVPATARDRQLAVGICLGSPAALGPYGGPEGGAIFYERGKPVRLETVNLQHQLYLHLINILCEIRMRKLTGERFQQLHHRLFHHLDSS